MVALPGEPPEWLPGEAEAHVLPTENTPGARLAWEQRQLPRIAGSLGAQLLHLTTATPALFSSLPVVLSPADFPAPKPKGIAARLRVALASGGLTRLDGLFWPAELECLAPAGDFCPRCSACRQNRTRISAATRAPGAAQLAALDLPETYILYHGPCDEAALQRLLAAWSWACGPVGEYYPVLLLGLDDKARQRLPSTGRGVRLPGHAAPPAGFASRGDPHTGAGLLGGCSIPLRSPRGAARRGWPWPTASRWWQPKAPQAVALAGPAAYLAPADDSRALGAALLTVIVEEQVAQTLGKAGLLRAAGWDSRSFGEALFAAYQAVLSPSKISRNGCGR